MPNWFAGAWLAIGGVLLSACDRPAAEVWTAPAASAADLFDVGKPVGEFELLDQQGRPFRNADLADKVWVIDFFFTSCGSVCPRMTEDMRSMASRLREVDDVRFLSISVDPQTDTPEVLREYAERFHADLDRWVFATGDLPAILQLAEKSFLSPIGEKLEDGQVPHSERFLILDRRSHLRSSRDRMGDADVVADVVHDVEWLVSHDEVGQQP